METTFIYALTEPGTRTIRYFGKADNPKKRRVDHIKDAKNGETYHVYNWIRKLLKAKQRPDVHVLCEVPQDDFARFERAFIALGKQCGFDLTNMTPGGEGGGGMLGKRHKPETRAKMSVSGKGKKHSPETLAKRLAAKLKHTPEWCDAQRVRMSGEKNPMFGKTGEQNPFFGCQHSDDSKAKMVGKKRPPEACAKMRKKRKGSRSPFHGVSWQTSRNTWNVTLSVSNKKLHIGVFTDELDAAKAYDIAAKIHHGAHAVLNFPD